MEKQIPHNFTPVRVPEHVGSEFIEGSLQLGLAVHTGACRSEGIDAWSHRVAAIGAKKVHPQAVHAQAVHTQEVMTPTYVVHIS